MKSSKIVGGIDAPASQVPFTLHSNLLPVSPSTQRIDVFDRNVIAFIVLKDGSEVVLHIAFAGVFFFTIQLVST